MWRGERVGPDEVLEIRWMNRKGWREGRTNKGGGEGGGGRGGGGERQ